jgi:hypothetical protein
MADIENEIQTEEKAPVAAKVADKKPSKAEDIPQEPVEGPGEPFLVRLRADHHYHAGFMQRSLLQKDLVVSSQHFDIDRMLKQGAQLDLVQKIDHDWEVLADLNSVE